MAMTITINARSRTTDLRCDIHWTHASSLAAHNLPAVRFRSRDADTQSKVQLHVSGNLFMNAIHTIVR